MTEWNKMVPELTVENFDASLDFYTRVLGFRVVHRREGFVYLDRDGAQLMLEAQHAEGWHTAALERPLGRGLNLQIEVQDIDALCARVRGTGTVLFRELKETWYRVSAASEEGQKEFLVQDPDGFLLRFSEPLGSRPLVQV